MSLAQAWGRKLLGASGVALLVPAAMAGAVGALVLAPGVAGAGLALGRVAGGARLPAGAGVGDRAGGGG